MFYLYIYRLFLYFLIKNSKLVGAYPSLSDTDLLQLLQESDHSAYTEIYHRYFYFIYTHASFFLLPQAGLECLIPDNEFKKNKISLATILKIEQTFTCSRTALLYRLKTLGIIDGTGYELFNKNIMRSALTYGYSIDLYKAGNHNKVIGDYGTVARALFEKEKISESHYLSLLLDLGMNTEEVERLSNGEEED